MNLPGLLVEYLINGCVAFLWLLRTGNVKDMITNLTEAEKLLLIPVAYVLGMFVDVLSWLITRPFKRRIRDNALLVVEEEMAEKGKKLAVDQYRLLWDDKVEIEKSYPDLNKELKSRSSRDRIARGTIINLIPITIYYWVEIDWLGVALTVGAALMWWRFEHYNHCFEIRAAVSVREGRRDAGPKTDHGSRTRRPS